MKIEYLGHSSFLLTTSLKTRIVTDPFDPGAYPDRMSYRPFRGRADVVTVSHEHSDHGAVTIVGGSPVVIKGDGKFRADETGPAEAYIDILGVGTFHDGERGAKRGRNTVFVITADGLRVAHMGDLGHVLTSDQAAEIGAVDVALIPIGGYYTIDAERALQVADQVSAQIIIPMHYASEKCSFPIAGVEEFITGKTSVKRDGVTSIELGPDDIPDEPVIMVLEPSL